MPPPNAMWGLTSRSKRTSSRVGELGLVGVGRADHDDDLIARVDRAAGELGVLHGHPGDAT